METTLFEKYRKQLSPLPTGQKPRGGLALPITCLLCDLYGTLFISGSGDISAAGLRDDAAPALQGLLDEHGLADTPRALLERLRAAIESAHEQAHQRGVDFPEVQIEEMWKSILPFEDPGRIRRFAVAFELIVNPVWPMPHALSLIQACQKASVLLGIISNAQFFTPYLFEWFFGRPADQLGFDPRLTIYSFQQGRAKPSTKLFTMAREQLALMGIDPPRVAFIGNDMRNDILPARKAGFQTILFAGDRRSLRLRSDDPACADVRADLVVSDLEQLLNYLLPT